MKTVIWHKILSHMWGKKVLYKYKRGEPVSKIHNLTIVLYMYRLLYFLRRIGHPSLLYNLFASEGQLSDPKGANTVCITSLTLWRTINIVWNRLLFWDSGWWAGGARRGALCKSRRFPCCWDFMGRHEQSTAAVAQPRSNRGNTHNTLREHFTLFQTLSSYIFLSSEVSTSKP